MITERLSEFSLVQFVGSWGLMLLVLMIFSIGQMVSPGAALVTSLIYTIGFFVLDKAATKYMDLEEDRS